jgi:outer membrane protein TolC
MTAAVSVALIAAGCSGIPTRSELQARGNLQTVTQAYRPGDRPPPLPALGTNATLATLLTYAMFNQPRVEAAYYDYAAAVERITVERSLPDPRLTLELDIQSVVTVVMPGLMTEMPWVQKLRIRADRMSAESAAKYHAFESAVLQTAYDVKRPYHQIHFLDERLRISREMLVLLGELEQSARAQTEASKVTLQDVLRAQIEQDRLKTVIANLEDSRAPLLAQLKAALGLRADQPNPPVPAMLESTPLNFEPEKVYVAAVSRNPRLKALEAEVRQTEVDIQLALQSRRPDFNIGIEADAKASPVMYRPSLSVTLPIWRDKLAAEAASARAGQQAAAARLSAEQIQLVADFAAKAFTYREATRNLKLLAESLLSKARLSLDVARAGYTAGRVDFINLLDAERTLLDFDLAAADARLQRELALAELSLLIAAIPPAGAPIPPPAPSPKDFHGK